MIKGFLHKPRTKSPWKKVSFETFAVPSRSPYCQFALHDGQKMFHKNVVPDQAFAYFEELSQYFRQGEIFTENEHILYFWDKKGVCTKKTKPLLQSLHPQTSHNRKKHTFLSSDTSYPFLIKLGIQSPQGVLLKDKRHKFTQIEQFLQHVFPKITHNGPILDFGCGKGYLTFALSWMLRDNPVEIHGYDLKQDVIEDLNRLTQELEFPRLFFHHASIHACHFTQAPQLVMALHACNRATDDAIARAVRLEAEHIFVAPCCHHEVSQQIRSDVFAPLLKHGILKQEFSALLTDTLRAELLESMGYRTEIVQFVDKSDTPKNLLIKAQKKRSPSPLKSSYHTLCETFEVTPYLETLLYP